MDDYHFTALADEQRRELLHSLLTESSLRLDRRPHRAPERAVPLHHVHLPKLARSGLVDWDRDAHRISRGPNFSEVEPVLEFLSSRNPAAAD